MNEEKLIRPPNVRGLAVADLMSRDVHTANESDTLEEAHKFMRMAGLRHLPVLDGNQELVGVLSDRDLLLGWSQGPSTKVAELMSRHTKWVHPETSARDAAAMMDLMSVSFENSLGNVLLLSLMLMKGIDHAQVTEVCRDYPVL